MMETPRSETFDDIYFQPENGLEESRYVFLKQNRLPELWAEKQHFTICETGFGTGLNFLCAWELFEQTAQADQQLTYISFEKYPLSKADILKYLGHWSGEFGGRLEQLASLYPLRINGFHKIRVSDHVTLLLIFDDVNRALPQLNCGVDCWFLDGHAPAKNPDMWSDLLFSVMGRLSNRGARFATFTSAGFVRRGLAAAGFSVSKERGYGRKREMCVGVFERDGFMSFDVAAPQRVAVIGGGIAGVSAARALKLRGVAVDLYEPNGLASGGSGNVRGLYNPRFTAQAGNESDFYSAAFSHQDRLLKSVSADAGYDPCGSIHVMVDAQKSKRFSGFLEHWGWHEDHARLIDRADTFELCGVDIPHDVLFLADAGMVSPKLLVPALAEGIPVISEVVDHILKIDGGWAVNARDYDAVILANAADVISFEQTAWLPVHTVRGQVAVIQTPDCFAGLKTNLCYGGYASCPFDGNMVVGSTFQPWLDDLALRDEDNQDVLAKLGAVVPAFDGQAEIVGARAGFRCAAKDRVPVIGAVPDCAGLYLSVAHGSHGLTTAPLAAEMLAAQMCGEVSPVPSNVLFYVSPQRFIGLRRE